MRPQSAAWAYSKAANDLRRSRSVSSIASIPLEQNPAAALRPRGIIRIWASVKEAPNSAPESDLKVEPPAKDDDDADSAISVEVGDDCSTPLAISQRPSVPIRQPYSDRVHDDDEKLQGRFYQRRPATAKRTPNFGGSAAAKAKSAISSRVAAQDSKQQLTASGGATSLPAWKLRKAMKTFKMTRLGSGSGGGGNGGPEADFGAPHIQYFLASLCDHPVSTLGADSKTSLASIDETNKDISARDNSSMSAGLRARCPLAAEVRKLVSKLRSSQPVNAQGFQLSVAVTVLKEFLSGIPGGVFGELTEEFYQISLESSLELTIVYLHSILHEMPYVVQQFTYLLCKALRNLIRLTGGSSLKNYTDLLMHFTPVLFASSVGDIDKFLRAARLLLVMVDDCERVFLPLPWLDANGNWCWHNGDFEDETFFRQIFDSLQNLEARLATDDSGVESEPEESVSALPVESALTRRSLSTCSLIDFYQVVYVDDASEESSSSDHNPYR